MVILDSKQALSSLALLMYLCMGATKSAITLAFAQTNLYIIRIEISTKLWKKP